MNKPFFHTEQITDRVTAVWSGCGEVMYYLQGEERGLLMDTNLGVRGLREIVDEISRTPYEVVLTHGHVDHALGAPEFGTVYLNHKDLPVYRAMCPLPERTGYLKANLGPGYADYGFTEEDFVPPSPDFPFRDLKEGDVFDLGGLTVELYAFPGHTPGTMILLLPEEEILITGDACNNATFLFDDTASTVEEYRQEAVRLEEALRGRYRRVFLCHHIVDTRASLLSEMIDVCDDVLAGRTDDAPFQFRGYEAFIAKACSPHFEREDGKSANLIYRKDKRWKTDGQG